MSVIRLSALVVVFFAAMTYAGIRVGNFQIVPGSCQKLPLIVNSQPVTTETCVAVREITVTPDTAKADTTTKKGPVK